MSVDVTELRAFYAGPLGEIARRVVLRAVEGFWGSVGGLGILGLGYATPYLPVATAGCARRFAFMPASQGVTIWPVASSSATALVDPLMLPLADESVDRVLVVHALETVGSPAELLHEAWRVLAPGGRVAVVAPNRRGLWARLDTTPFGHGQPFSRSQLRALLHETMFGPAGWAEILYVPPLRSRLLLGGAAVWEQLGVGLSLPFAGLHVVDATKLLHRPMRVRKARRSRSLRPVLVPVPAASHRDGHRRDVLSGQRDSTVEPSSSM